MVCKKCNSTKGDKRLYEWFGLGHKDEIPNSSTEKIMNRRKFATLHEGAYRTH